MKTSANAPEESTCLLDFAFRAIDSGIKSEHRHLTGDGDSLENQYLRKSQSIRLKGIITTKNEARENMDLFLSLLRVIVVE